MQPSPHDNFAKQEGEENQYSCHDDELGYIDGMHVQKAKGYYGNNDKGANVSPNGTDNRIDFISSPERPKGQLPRQGERLP